MRFPTVIFGFLATALAAAVLGAAAGFETGKLVLFVLAVFILSQLTYVGAVAILAASRSLAKRDAAPRLGVERSRVSNENDV